MSFARHTTTLNKTFLFLTTDYSKSAHLQEDRSIEFHTPQGMHYSVRIPRYGRDLAYNRASAELLIPAVGVNQNGLGEVFRINLEQGQFMREYEVDVGGDDTASIDRGALQGGINTGSVNAAAVAEESHNLLAFGTSLGSIEFWDSRSRARVATLLSPDDPDADHGRAEITALDFHRTGMTCAAGSSSGLVYLYDLRSPIPLLKKDQGYGYPIQTLKFLTPSTSTRVQTPEPKVLSADKRIIKIWDERDGAPWTSVEPAVDINSVAWCKDSGMILTANEGRQQHAFFIPQLGPAPSWCSFLDNLVEEMAEDPNDPNAFAAQKAGAVYDNYKFLTVPQLRDLGMDHLVGKTNLLRPYMHGYFVAQRLYDEARLIANPSSWEDERAKRIKEKIDKERESRIRGKKQVTAKVNRKMAEKILEREEKNERRRAQRVLQNGGDQVVEPAGEETTAATEKSGGILEDSRFSRLFQDPEFEIDEASREFQSINPSTKTSVPRPEGKERGLTAVEAEAVEEVPGSTSESGSDVEAVQIEPRSDRVSTASYKRKPQAKSKTGPRMEVSSSSSKPKHTRDRSFASRIEKTRSVQKSRSDNVVGERMVTFEPREKKGREKSFLRPPVSQGKRKEPSDRRSASMNTFRRL